jgi:glycosyltransferase involved in cell wall biosynthesis
MPQPGSLTVRTGSDRPLSVAFVATCPPRQCGIATFTSDLASALRVADPRLRVRWAAIDSAESINAYGPDVHWRIRQLQPASYRQAAEEINATRVDVVNVQHEFGLYGVWGDPFEDHLAPFLETLRKPLVTTLHSVLPNPSPSVREAVQRIGRRSHTVVGMAELARRLLVEHYGLDPATVRVIPHGVPAIQPRARRRTKERLGLQGRTIILTFGLVDPRKGLEYMIGAMERVVASHPDALYLIVGKTHPALLLQAGESYRRELCEMVRSRGLEQHVAFVDQYLSQREIVDYLLASDAYVTPYVDPNQITSGTLAYALGAGKAIVSTRYLHAVEVLSEGRGLLVDFRSEEQLADAVLTILDDPALKQQLEQDAYAYGNETAWPRVAERMLDLFRAADTDQEAGWQPLSLSEQDRSPRLEMPASLAASTDAPWQPLPRSVVEASSSEEDGEHRAEALRPAASGTH